MGLSADSALASMPLVTRDEDACVPHTQPISTEMLQKCLAQVVHQISLFNETLYQMKQNRDQTTPAAPVNRQFKKRGRPTGSKNRPSPSSLPSPTYPMRSSSKSPADVDVNSVVTSQLGFSQVQPSQNASSSVQNEDSRLEVKNPVFQTQQSFESHVSFTTDSTSKGDIVSVSSDDLGDLQASHSSSPRPYSEGCTLEERKKALLESYEIKEPSPTVARLTSSILEFLQQGSASEKEIQRNLTECGIENGSNAKDILSNVSMVCGILQAVGLANPLTKSSSSTSRDVSVGDDSDQPNSNPNPSAGNVNQSMVASRADTIGSANPSFCDGQSLVPLLQYLSQMPTLGLLAEPLDGTILKCNPSYDSSFLTPLLLQAQLGRPFVPSTSLCANSVPQAHPTNMSPPADTSNPQAGPYPNPCPEVDDIHVWELVNKGQAVSKSVEDVGNRLNRWTLASFDDAKASEAEEKLLRQLCKRSGMSLPSHLYRSGTRYLSYKHKTSQAQKRTTPAPSMPQPLASQSSSVIPCLRPKTPTIKRSRSQSGAPTDYPAHHVPPMQYNDRDSVEGIGDRDLGVWGPGRSDVIRLDPTTQHLMMPDLTIKTLPLQWADLAKEFMPLQCTYSDPHTPRTPQTSEGQAFTFTAQFSARTVEDLITDQGPPSLKRQKSEVVAPAFRVVSFDDACPDTNTDTNPPNIDSPKSGSGQGSEEQSSDVDEEPKRVRIAGGYRVTEPQEQEQPQDGLGASSDEEDLSDEAIAQRHENELRAMRERFAKTKAITQSLPSAAGRGAWLNTNGKTGETQTQPQTSSKKKKGKGTRVRVTTPRVTNVKPHTHTHTSQTPKRTRSEQVDGEADA